MRKSAIAKTSAVAVGAAIFAAPVHADVILLDLQWQFYQGGYVQHSPSEFSISQEFFSGNPAQSTLSQTFGGATFESVASMDVNIQESPGYYSIAALNELSVSASVGEQSPLGLAHSFASLSAFIVRFEIAEGSYVYSGNESLFTNKGTEVQSGSVLSVGEYNYFEFNFGGPLTETAFVGVGEADYAFSSRMFSFSFTAIPTPSALWLGATLLLPPRRRRSTSRSRNLAMRCRDA